MTFWKSRIKELENEIVVIENYWSEREKDLLSELDDLRELLKSPSAVIEAVLERKISWYDWEELDIAKKQKYYREIQMVLESEALKNEINHYISDVVEEIAYTDADSNKDKILRYSINGVKALMERLTSLRDPKEKEPSEKDLHSVV